MRREKRLKYDKSLPRQMYSFFASYSDAASAPSFVKFARHIGTTVAELESFREKEPFNLAYRECLEIRRDYLEDRALTKRFDPTFVKFLIGDAEERECETELTENFAVKVEVVDET